MKLLSVGVFLWAGAAAAWAQEWSPPDARSRSLGGAGVAFADGRSDSLYWNPATLAVGSEKVLDFSTGFSFSMSLYADAHVIGDVASRVTYLVDQFETYDFLNVQNNFNSATPTFTDTDVQNVLRIVDSLTRLDQEGEGILIQGGTSFTLRVGPFGLFLRGHLDLAQDPLADLNGIGLTTDSAAFFGQLSPAGALSPAGTALATQLTPSLGATDAANLAFQAQTGLGDAAISDPAFIAAMVALAQGTAAGSPTTLYNSNSGVMMRALVQAEAGISFAIPVLPTLLDVGISLKEVLSETSFYFLTFALQDSGTDVGEAVRDDIMKNNRKRSMDFNMDLGARATPLPFLTLALSARNVIPMDLDFAGPGGKLHQDPQVRFGALAQALGFIKVGFDVDLIENESPVLPGYTTRHFGAGLEFDLPVLKIRVGYDANLAFKEDHGRVTAGFGLDVFGFVLDVGAQASIVKTEIKAAAVDGSDPAESFATDRLSMGLTLGVNVTF